MADENPDIPILPYDADSFDPTAPQKSRPAVLGEGFAYDGRALTINEFAAHVARCLPDCNAVNGLYMV